MGLRVNAVSRLDQRGRAGHAPCPTCGETRRTYGFTLDGMSLERCSNCNLLMLAGDGGGPGRTGVAWSDETTERDAARGYLRALAARGAHAGRILFITSSEHPVSSAIERAGGKIGRKLKIEDLMAGAASDLAPGSFDAALVLFQLEESPDPAEALARIRALLRPEGVLLLVMPTLDAPPVRLLGPKWTGWRPENRYYFDRMTI